MALSHPWLQGLVDWRARERPIEWQELFPGRDGLVVEIGCGYGDFLAKKAAEDPRRAFVGLDQEWIAIRRALRKISAAGLKNAGVLKADGGVALERLFSPRSIESAYSLFPCPWPKRRHVKHRLFSHDFLRLLNSRMKDGRRFTVVTDHAGFLSWILDQLPGAGFEVRVTPIYPSFSTKYEKKWRRLGKVEFHEIRMTKRRHIPVPVKEDATLRAHRVKQLNPDGLGLSGCGGEVVVNFKELLYDSRRRKGMVRCVVSEGNLLQGFWIEFVKREQDWLIRPAKGCALIPTQGVQSALDLVREAALQDL